ncbi:unnamed protein product [Mycena citricolor]|uniref:Retrotransposon gag domain-containing protein n=1 Tax=Mycena citricolor TaxID=2018698 RepID=A0AAD2H1U2_9AGAR|nr:unnamed protein product [Mycena citricolor]CAK5266981.1 unnamed protein product [Mycena citricolor]
MPVLYLATTVIHLWILPCQNSEIGFDADSNSGDESTSDQDCQSVTSFLAPSSPPRADPTSIEDDNSQHQLSALETSIQNIEAVLNRLLNQQPPAPALAPAPAVGPGVSAGSQSNTVRPLIRPNPPFLFDGDRTLGKSFLHSVKQYWRLLPEAFFVNGVVAEEKVVRFTLSYMSKDSAASWSERMSERTPFPFPTWALFVTEFKLRFVEENEQDHALAQLETHQYYMGSRNVFKYMDEYDDLLDLAGYTDNLVKVTKYRTGLDPRINQAITTSGNPPSLTDYAEWCKGNLETRSQSSGKGESKEKPCWGFSLPGATIYMIQEQWSAQRQTRTMGTISTTAMTEQWERGQ